MTDLEQTVASSRVERLEDELAIRNLIVRYGFAADVGDAARRRRVAPDGVYDVDVAGWKGATPWPRWCGARHQSMVEHCAHQMGPQCGARKRRRAVATGYHGCTCRPRRHVRLSCELNRWELVKQDEEWLVAHRTTCVLGNDEAPAILRQFWTAAPHRA
jgi:hypothetical protein